MSLVTREPSQSLTVPISTCTVR